MQPLPHHYSVRASGDPKRSVQLASHNLPVLFSAPPKEFDGPGDQWSPEELFLAAVPVKLEARVVRYPLGPPTQERSLR
jgi:organic hydroperoxide reductase OsmC/OhrA